MVTQYARDLPGCDICGADAFMSVSGLRCWTHAPRCVRCREVMRDPNYEKDGTPCEFRGSDEYAEIDLGLVHVGCMREGDEIA